MDRLAGRAQNGSEILFVLDESQRCHPSPPSRFRLLYNRSQPRQIGTRVQAVRQRGACAIDAGEPQDCPRGTLSRLRVRDER